MCNIDFNKSEFSNLEHEQLEMIMTSNDYSIYSHMYTADQN